MIARALIHDPQALILDEPSNSLDIGALQELLATMRRLTQSGTNLILVRRIICPRSSRRSRAWC